MAWSARYIGVPCSVVVADDAPQTKFDAIEQLGGHNSKGAVGRCTGRSPAAHVSTASRVTSSTLSPTGRLWRATAPSPLEVLQDLPDVDAILAPYGGGGLATGVASAVRAVKPDVKVYATEVETGAPVAASFRLGQALRTWTSPPAS